MREHIEEHTYESAKEDRYESTRMRAHVRACIGEHTCESAKESTHRRAHI